MRTIWKYEIKEQSVSTDIPVGAKLLSFQMQNNIPTVWFEVDPEERKEQRRFSLVGTGWKFMAGGYLGTAQQGPLVWHLYEDWEE
jgi:hypothetical protein